jgi:hypothetical protein
MSTNNSIISRAVTLLRSVANREQMPVIADTCPVQITMARSDVPSWLEEQEVLFGCSFYDRSSGNAGKANKRFLARFGNHDGTPSEYVQDNDQSGVPGAGRPRLHNFNQVK